MQKIINTIETFQEANISLLKNVLHNQFQQHFNFLVENISSIEKIEFSFHQVDEDFYTMTDFILTKNNGYTYQYIYEADNEIISHWEFFKAEIQVIDAFMDYLFKSARYTVNILGGGDFSFTKNSAE